MRIKPCFSKISILIWRIALKTIYNLTQAGFRLKLHVWKFLVTFRHWEFELCCAAAVNLCWNGFRNWVYCRVDQLRHQPTLGWRFLPFGLNRTRNFSHALAKAILPSNITWKFQEKCASERVKSRWPEARKKHREKWRRVQTSFTQSLIIL